MSRCVWYNLHRPASNFQFSGKSVTTIADKRRSCLDYLNIRTEEWNAHLEIWLGAQQW